MACHESKKLRKISRFSHDVILESVCFSYVFTENCNKIEEKGPTFVVVLLLNSGCNIQYIRGLLLSAFARIKFF